MAKHERFRLGPDYFWSALRNTMDDIAKYYVRYAQEAELREKGHECGHQFIITTTSIMHSGITGEGPESHRDAQPDPEPIFMQLEVRAHDLQAALVIAACAPLAEWRYSD